MPEHHLTYLFGGDRPWKSGAWTASDDRVRGGRSQSYLRCPSDEQAEFRGHLDITALGGAGFASQRTAESLNINLSGHEGINIRIDATDGKKYTLTLKDEILPRRPDGREQSTVSWEYDFEPENAGELFITWSDFKPTYRGKPKSDATPLDLAHVKRISLMMRSFFGEQQGDFNLTINHVAAFTTRPSSKSSSSVSETSHTGKSQAVESARADNHHSLAWTQWLCGWFR